MMKMRHIATLILLAFSIIGVIVALSGCGTQENQIIRELEWSSRSFTTKYDKCDDILKTEDWCNVIRGVAKITRPEWDELFPKTEFYVVRRLLVGSELPKQSNLLIVEQDGQQYTPKTFDILLAANRIKINDDNQELIAKALALMTLPDYLENEITFTKWEVDTTQPAPFDYCLTAWTKIQGLVLKWCFMFSNPQYELIAAGPEVDQDRSGDYIDVSNIDLPYPIVHNYYFHKR
jgi:hypothetical protein